MRQKSIRTGKTYRRCRSGSAMTAEIMSDATTRQNSTPSRLVSSQRLKLETLAASFTDFLILFGKQGGMIAVGSIMELPVRSASRNSARLTFGRLSSAGTHGVQ